MGMSEGLAYGPQEPARNRSQPAYGDNRHGHEEPAVEKEHLDGRAELLIAVAIFLPVVAAYGGAGYAVYRAASALV